MDQVETFRGLRVPDREPMTQTDYCHASPCSSCTADTKLCLFDYERPETLEPFNEWMETRKK